MAIAEQKALKVSIAGALMMAGLGVGFAWLTQSEAIMLDGVFSGIGFVMALLTLKASSLVKQPDDEHFHFGYAHFAPLLNVIKSLLMICLCGFALIMAIDSLLHGGRSLVIGSAVIYGVISTIGCVAIAIYLHKKTRITGSVLLALDARSWVIDSMMSGAVLISFVGGYFMAKTDWAVYMNYLDPGLVTILCLLALPMPIRVLLNNMREVLLFAPDPELQASVERQFLKSLGAGKAEAHRIRLLKMGNTMNILVHAKLADSGAQFSTLELDQIRHRFNEQLREQDLHGIADIVFVNDMALAN